MFKNIFKHRFFTENNPINVIGLNKNVRAAYIWSLFCQSHENIIVVTNTLYDANNLYKNLSVFSSKDILFFPMDDFFISEAVAISPDLKYKRIETLNTLSNNNKNKIIITNLMGYLRFLPTKTLWKKNNILIECNSYINKENLISSLNSNGYIKTDIVSKTGEFSNRGYILDVFPYGNDNPIRIEFFDDEVDEIREFNLNTQLSIRKINQIEISPVTEFINEKKIENIPDRQSLLPRVVYEVSSLSDYIGDNITVYSDLDEIKLSYKNLLNEIVEFKEKDKFIIKNYMWDLLKIIPNKYINLYNIDNLSKQENIENYNIIDIEKFNSNYQKINFFINNMLQKKYYICVYLEENKIIKEFCNNINFKTIITNEDSLKKDFVNIIKKDIPTGFIINNLVLISKKDLYNSSLKVNYKNNIKYGTKIKDINKLHIGDYVVHSLFGIGKYLGIITLESKGIKKDYLYLMYKDNDKLYVPVEKIEYIYKYSSNEGAVPRLNKLGSKDWIKQKARVKIKAKDIAKELFETSVKRKASIGFAFNPDDNDEIEFSNKFKYIETPDQLKAIKDIKEDMQLPIPMDRLLCGDVGYGKTEVAFRAIFKAIKSGKQAAFLCPTTILSKQHYDNALDRFMGFGVNIEVLNRFITPKKENEIYENLKNGKIDLIIGTHKLLNKKIVFKDLGLLVVDEEQRFGVTHKERIKEIKQNIDILTLSATPIPRTLQMSLSGVRGLSLIETPPAYRYPVQTYVLRENNQIVKDAIYKELAREGQVFILYNNINKLENLINLINRLVPEAKITYIHGQMKKTEIENRMEDFILKKYDILLCTTIIETGIDIQNANTLIIYDADHFGLSQLYQIRGRIGRGKNIGYAYLMYNKNKELNDIAKKRLDAIKEFTELGSGYSLAVRDLSIRGAGNLLGAEQSGFIDSIGYDVYLKILNDEVNKLNGIKMEEKESLIIEKPFLQVSTHIDDKYAESDDLKIQIHKKINEIDSYSKFEQIKKELEDRFGILDETIIIYMLEELFQVKAKKSNVLKIEQNTDKITTYFSKNVLDNLDGADLLSKLFKISPDFNLELSNNILKIVLNLKYLDKHFIYYMIQMIHIFE